MTHPDCAPNGTILKPTHSDGHCSTWNMAPQACPICGAVLVIRTGEAAQPDEVVCPWECEEAEV